METPVVAYGTGGVLGVLAFYMFRQLRRSDDALWKILAEKDRQLKAGTDREVALAHDLALARDELVRARTEAAFWRGIRLSAEDVALAQQEAQLHELPPARPGPEPGNVAGDPGPKRPRRRRHPGG